MRKILVLVYLLTFPGYPIAISSQAAQTVLSISGVVEDETGQPVSGMEVTLFKEIVSQRTSTNELGHFRFEAVPTGSYFLNFDKTGFFRLHDYEVRVTSEAREITVTVNHEYE